ncbi:putative esterase/lipase [Cyphellophora attinorum]|uniref:Putative esterase/lipase n=1 Tax=Cyphellophora attinorum TaxID=1664694 RepID=A0A0N1HJX5_9EURO|nr:putative esterase/lipase [Phialophora attinorum]KPI34374.1 putative esterase/lipase [Phialophora attinorum]
MRQRHRRTRLSRKVPEAGSSLAAFEKQLLFWQPNPAEKQKRCTSSPKRPPGLRTVSTSQGGYAQGPNKNSDKDSGLRGNGSVAFPSPTSDDTAASEDAADLVHYSSGQSDLEDGQSDVEEILIQYYLQYGGGSKLPQQFLRAYRETPATFNAFLALMSNNFTDEEGQAAPIDSAELENKALREVSAQISHSPSAPASSTMLAVAVLANLRECRHEYELVDCHWNALRRMIEINGGINRLRMHQDLYTFILWLEGVVLSTVVASVAQLNTPSSRGAPEPNELEAFLCAIDQSLRSRTDISSRLSPPLLAVLQRPSHKQDRYSIGKWWRDFTYGDERNPRPHCEGCKICPQPGWPGVQADTPRTEWDEDCLQANIWVPSKSAPEEGWPVLFYIHGGFLQFGSASKSVDAMAQMFQETDLNAIVVGPAYRVNLFGFLASKELSWEAKKEQESVGNMGFWDQRTALEWTADVIGAFGGNPNNITIAGYSAGAHSVFQQLSYDLFLPDAKSLVRRAIMWSNGPGVQPKTLEDHQIGFDELLEKLNISSSESPSQKLYLLRQIPSSKLIEAVEAMRSSQFRGLSDGHFIDPALITKINNGDYGARMKRRGVKLMMGENRDEHNLYRAWKTPENSYQAVYERLCADYPASKVANILSLYAPGSELSSNYSDWVDLFGKVYADIQVHCLERGFVDKLAKAGLVVGKDVLRYRFEWRAKCVDEVWPKAWGVTHATDTAIWWWGDGQGDGLEDEEKRILKPWHDIFARFVAGHDVQWQRTGSSVVLRLTDQGTMDLWDDTRYDEGQIIWDMVNGKGDMQARI